jgi:hypothetical protein
MVDHDLDRPIWGADAIARAINRAPRATYHLLENGHLDADRVGGRWVSTPRRLREQFAGTGKFAAAPDGAKAVLVGRSASEVER